MEEETEMGETNKFGNTTYTTWMVSAGTVVFGLIISGSIILHNTEENKILNAEPEANTTGIVVDKLPEVDFDDEKEYLSNSREYYVGAEGVIFDRYGRPAFEGVEVDIESYESVGGGGSYSKDINNVYIGDKILVGASPENFTVKSHGQYSPRFGVSGKAVFWYDVLLDGIDGESFEFINAIYGKDKNYIYTLHPNSRKSNRVEDFDVETFELIPSGQPSFSPDSDQYSKDKNGVYFRSNSVLIDHITIEFADPDTFEVLSQGGSYAKDKNNVYYLREIIEGADSNSFTVSPSGFWRDSNYIYLNGSPEKLIDPDTFEALEGCYYRDKFRVYCSLTEGAGPQYISPLPLSDPETFSLVTGVDGERYGNQYAFDKDHVYKYMGLIEGADPDTFKIFDEDLPRIFYLADSESVFYLSKKIEGADPETFVSFGGGFGKDSSNVYVMGKVVKNVDVDTFIKVKDTSFSQDKNNVYYGGDLKIFEEADVLTFESLGNGFYKDKNNVYWNDDIVTDADPESLILLGGYYVQDDVAIYYTDHKVEGADIDTFEMWTYYHGVYARDKTNVYKAGETVPGNPDGYWWRHGKLPISL